MSDPDPSEPEGNDFDQDLIDEWFKDEERYHNQFDGGLPGRCWVFYDVFNDGYVFKRFFHPGPDSRVLDFGCAEGSGIAQLRSTFDFQLSGIDASDVQLRLFRDRYPDSRIRKASPSGDIDFENDFFDYVIEISTLHHVANVSHVLSELSRVLKCGGIMIIREPISSMREKGNRNRKTAASPRERGIPVKFMFEEFSRLKLDVVHFRYAFSTPVMFMVEKLRILERVPGLVLAADKVVSLLLSPNVKYNRKTLLARIAPCVVYCVVRKRTSDRRVIP